MPLFKTHVSKHIEVNPSPFSSPPKDTAQIDKYWLKVLSLPRLYAGSVELECYPAGTRVAEIRRRLLHSMVGIKCSLCSFQFNVGPYSKRITTLMKLILYSRFQDSRENRVFGGPTQAREARYAKTGIKSRCR